MLNSNDSEDWNKEVLYFYEVLLGKKSFKTKKSKYLFAFKMFQPACI
jgi:hypothetical protein